MKITLIDYTGIGWPDPAERAATILIFTKQTRLTMSPSLMEEIGAWPQQKREQELSYMANTIPSSWEYVDYTFLIEGVTRAFTHQLVRTRTASFAQQTMRVLNVEGWEYGSGPSVSGLGIDPKPEGADLRRAIYKEAMDDCAEAYKNLITAGAKIEDARGVLPTNILTNIVMKINMRNFVGMVRSRSSSRTQDEYRLVLNAMKEAAIQVHPWLSLFIERTFERAATDLDFEISEIANPDKRTRMTKLVDQMRSQS